MVLGMDVPKPKEPLNHNFGADANEKDYQDHPARQTIEKSEALSMANTIKDSIKSRKIAILAATGVDSNSIKTVKDALEAEGAQTKIVAPKGGYITCSKGGEIKVDYSFLTTGSVLFDAVFIPAGERSVQALVEEADAIHFVNEAYRHCKAIAADGDGIELLNETYIRKKLKKGDTDEIAGIITGDSSGSDSFSDDFIEAIAQHRFWEREKKSESTRIVLKPGTSPGFLFKTPTG